MRMKKFLAATLTAAMVFSLTACGGSSDSSSGKEDTASSSSDSSGDKISIGFAQVGHESDWRTASTESCRSTFSEENGYDLKFVDCDNKSADQLEAVRNFIEQEVDYIIIDPIVTTGWDTVLKEAKDAGIPVLVIDREIEADDSLYTAWVGSDFTAEGQAAGAWLKAYLDAKKITKKVNIVTIAGTNGSSAQIGRTKGFNQYVKSNGWNLLDEQDGDFTQDGGQKIMESYLKSYKDIDVVVCQNDNEAFGAIDAIKAAGYEVGADKDMMVFSFDSTKEGLKKVQSGEITLNTECNPLHGPRVEAIIKQLENKETPEKKAYVDEEMFAHDDTVKSVTVDGKEYPVTVVTDEVMGTRKY